MYKGDLPPIEAHQRLKANASAVLIDVRTQPEWTFVGVPAVERLVRLSWQVYPTMDVNARFAEEVQNMACRKMPRFSVSVVQAPALPRLQQL